jgi:AbrB family looped-hinge helix DNA binding protein
MAVKKPIAVKMDAAGKITLPKAIREKLGAHAGDVFYVVEDGKGGLRIIKENPFDVLAEEAIKLDDEGKTIPLEEALRRLGLD